MSSFANMKIVFVSLLFIKLALSADPTVTIKNGVVKGAEYSTPDGNAFYGFRGMPFGKPPIGDLRFEPPQAADSWTDTYDATFDRAACVSDNYFSNQENESEDCLYVTVYTPSLTPAEALPVVFWIYGGSFMEGNASKLFYGPDFFMDDQEVVYVTFNYRVGPFGFLSTGDTTLPGNMGFKDALLALQWAYDNVASFGGDPDKITLMGESAGAVISHAFLFNKNAKGLFRAVINQSGGTLSTWAFNPDPMSITNQYLASLKATDVSDSASIKSFFKSKSVDEIMQAAPTIDQISPAYPVIEVENDSAFITQSPYTLLESGDFIQVPTLTGICSEESYIVYFVKTFADQYAAAYDANNTLLIPKNLIVDSSNIATVVSAIRGLYLEDGATFASNLTALAKFFSDAYFVKHILKEAEFQSTYSSVYFYNFDYYGKRIVLPAFIDGANNVTHGGDLPYLFNMPRFTSTDETDHLIQTRMISLWTNFVKYLNPTPDSTDLLQNISWPVFTKEDGQYLDINVDFSIKSHLRQSQMDAWLNIYDTYGQKPFITY